MLLLPTTPTDLINRDLSVWIGRDWKGELCRGLLITRKRSFCPYAPYALGRRDRRGRGTGPHLTAKGLFGKRRVVLSKVKTLIILEETISLGCSCNSS